MPNEYELNVDKIKQGVKRNFWRHLMHKLNIKMVAPQSDLNKLDQLIERECPEFTLENIRNHLGDIRETERGLGSMDRSRDIDSSMYSFD